MKINRKLAVSALSAGLLLSGVWVGADGWPSGDPGDSFAPPPRHEREGRGGREGREGRGRGAFGGHRGEFGLGEPGGLGGPELLARALANPEVAKKIGLTEEQIESIKADREKRQETAKSGREAIEGLRKQLHELMTGEADPDASEVDAIVGQLAVLESEQQRQRLQHVVTVRQILTTEQETALRNMADERRDRFEERRQQAQELSDQMRREYVEEYRQRRQEMMRGGWGSGPSGDDFGGPGAPPPPPPGFDGPDGQDGPPPPPDAPRGRFGRAGERGQRFGQGGPGGPGGPEFEGRRPAGPRPEGGQGFGGQGFRHQPPARGERGFDGRGSNREAATERLRQRLANSSPEAAAEVLGGFRERMRDKLEFLEAQQAEIEQLLETLDTVDPAMAE